ncbi:MAG: enoyl-CoA hydratase/isomerase family protein [Chloroflexi bacterium]|nr:enoyl-CoA hydratase/isomerase family protein [Chloroflexota bacterium]
MSANELVVEKDGPVCTITINRPDKRNALNVAVLVGIGDALKSLSDNKEIRAVILRGAGEEAFSSGMDLTDSDGRAGEKGKRGPAMQSAREGILGCPCPVIAMIFGYVAGAACDLVVACDFRIAADNARLALNAVKIGLVHDYQGIQRLVNLVGIGYAKEILLAGEFVDARRAREMGLLNFTVPRDELVPFAASFAGKLAQNPPLAMAGTKRVMARLLSYQRPSPEALAEIQASVDASWRSEDTREARRAFAEKRKPVFKGS